MNNITEEWATDINRDLKEKENRMAYKIIFLICNKHEIQKM